MLFSNWLGKNNSLAPTKMQLGTTFTYILKVPYYTVFHQFHTADRGPATLFSRSIGPNPSMVLDFSCLKVAQVSSTENRLFLCLHL